MLTRFFPRRLHEYWMTTGHRINLTRTLTPQLAVLEGRVLDVGGGRNAPHDEAIAARIRRVRVDISARNRPDVLADAANLPFSDESCDGVIAVELLEHVPEPARVPREFHRVMRPGGTLVGSVPFVIAVHGDPNDYYRYTADALRVLLQPFSEVTVLPFGNHWSAAWSLLSRRSRTLRVFNPLLRNLGTKPDRMCPQGWVFIAVK